MGTTLAVGDEGFWVTYQKGMKTKTYRELRELCDEVWAARLNSLYCSFGG